MKRGGGRRYYRPEDMELLRGIRQLLHSEGYQIKGVQKILREQGIDHVKKYGRVEATDSRQSQARRAREAVSAGEDAATRRSVGDAKTRETGRASSKKAPSVDTQEIVATAIRELQTCRKMLLETVGKAESSRSPRRARTVNA